MQIPDFRLRHWTIQDVPSLVKYLNNKNIADNLRDGFPSPYTEQDAEWFINSAKNDDCLFAVEIDGEAVGSIGITLKEGIYRSSAELGFWLAQPFWKRGIMTEAVKQMIAFTFEKKDIIRLYAQVYEYNEGSKRVLLKAGFTCEGVLGKSVCKNGRVYDNYIYAVLDGRKSADFSV